MGEVSSRSQIVIAVTREESGTFPDSQPKVFRPPLRDESFQEESLSLCPGRELCLDLCDWQNAYLKVVRGKVEWDSAEGFSNRAEKLSEGAVVRLFTFGWHRLRAFDGRCELRLTLLEPRSLPEIGPFSPQKLALPSLGEEGASRQQLESDLREVARHSVRTDTPYFMNQLFSGRTLEGEIASQLAYELRTTLATQEASPVLSSIECEVARALSKLCGWPESAGGIAVPGGTFGNFMGLHLARHRKDPNAHKEGSDGTKFGIFASDQAHYSIEKAALVMGFGRDAVVSIAIDSNGAMRSEVLKEAIEIFSASGGVPLAVVATSGTTVLGAFDPLKDIAEICEKANLWLHVDGAWGGPVIFSKQSRILLDGIERADSFSLDAHKLLGAPLTSTMFLTREARALLSANEVKGGSYLFHEANDALAHVDRGLFSWQCGRGPDALQFWALWRSLGSNGLGDFIDKLFILRNRLVQKLEAEPRIHLVHRPQFLNVCFRVSPPVSRAELSPMDWTRHVRKALKDSGKAFINYSGNSEGFFLRMILAHPQLTWDTLETMVQDILEVR